MPYRDDRDTLKQRVEELETELADARQEIEQRKDLTERLLRIDAELARTRNELAELNPPEVSSSEVQEPRQVDPADAPAGGRASTFTAIGALVGFVAAAL